MKVITTIMLLIAILNLAYSTLRFWKLRKQFCGTLYCSEHRITLASSLYIGLLIFFQLAYILFTISWVCRPHCSSTGYLVMLLLFFGSIFVGLSTLFLDHFVKSVLGIKTEQTDTMTGLLTKTGIELAAQKILDEDSSLCVLAVLDLDQFKLVNDTMGHAAGDQVIHLVAHTIRSVLRTDDLIGRFGGDEYIVILRGISTVQAESIMKRIEARVHTALDENGFSVCTGISYGLAELRGGSRELYSDLFAKADAALYQMKREKKQLCSCGASEAQV